MKTLVGIVTFGNLEFTKLAVRGVRETGPDVDIALIVGKPGDEETAAWVEAQSSKFKVQRHTENMGMGASCNDLWDFALGRDYDNLILMGNDVVPYPGAIAALVACAEQTDYEWIAAAEFDVKMLTARYPVTREVFTGENYQFTDFTARPWEIHAPAVAACPPEFVPDAGPVFSDLCLFKRSMFDKLGYFDVNFWPNGYFCDNDYARRAVNAGVRHGELAHAQYFHFWSRTIHQGGSRPHAKYFEANRDYYLDKWGGLVGAETIAAPVKIPTRAGEAEAIAHWRDQ